MYLLDTMCVGGKEVGLLTSQHQLLNRGRLKLMLRSQYVH